VLSAIAALVGVLTPIALSFALMYAGFGFGMELAPSMNIELDLHNPSSYNFD
jgi:hypothetical protein